jgi:hypothetical protein
MRIALYSALSMSVFAASALAETTTPLKKQYSEPTRGFLIEHGTVSGQGKASVELYTGSSDQISDGGGIRLGLKKAEVIFNSGLNGYDKNEAMLKWGMSDLNLNQTPVHLSLIAAVSHLDVDNDNDADYDQTHIKLGAAATISADAATFTLAPQFVYTDYDEEGSPSEDDTFIEVGLGGYIGVIDTASGLFSLGAEFILTTADDTDNTFALGGRWAYNEQLNIDIIPAIFSGNDLIGIPGLVRLNVAF